MSIEDAARKPRTQRMRVSRRPRRISRWVPAEVKGWVSRRGWPEVLVVGALAAALLVIANPRQPTTVHGRQNSATLFADDSFDQTDWTLDLRVNQPASQGTAFKLTQGGNPGAFRQVTHRLASGTPMNGSSLVSLHKRTDAVYDPAVSGPIDALCYREDAFILEGHGQGQSTGVALWQGGEVFFHGTGPTYMPPDWLTIEATALVAADFDRLAPPLERDAARHPDFTASGPPITFGFYRSNTTYGEGWQIVGAIDNWRVGVNSTCYGLPTPPTATPEPSALYLPIALKELCDSTTQRIDVALVIDASSSMAEHTRAGQPKFDAAVSASRAFLDLLDLGSPNGNQAAIVVFNRDAWIRAPLTGDRAVLDRALTGIALAQQSRIDRAFAVGAAALADVRRRRVGNRPALVLLSDGRADPAHAKAALSDAARAKASGVSVFTVGLGEDMDTETLIAIASRPEYFHGAADADDLAAILAEVSRTLPCPLDAFWSRR